MYTRSQRVATHVLLLADFFCCFISNMRVSSTISLLISFLFSTCDESLPPRNEPRDFLQANYGVSEGAVEIRDSTVQNLAGTVVISVKNIYVEVLQEDESAHADIEVWLLDLPGQRGKIAAVKRDLTNQSLVVGGKLTLRPN